MDEILFQTACDAVLRSQERSTLIGTLSEKTVHAILKNYLEPDASCHEIKVGSFFADVKNASGIFEIQTRHFYKLREKLAFFLEDYPVTVVYPIPHYKYLRWIDPKTGQISPARRSPKTGSIYQVFTELYRIKPLLTHPNFHLKLVLMDLEEYRYLDGYSRNRKKGSTRCDRIPTALVAEEDFFTPKDYVKFLPELLPERFTSKDYHLATKLPQGSAATALGILTELGVLLRVGKVGNAFLYEKREG